MTANLNTASIKSAVGTTARTLGARWADIINVKDFGAVGNGIADDAVAIQAAFDAAFGTFASPHGNSTNVNLPVFFPKGTYNVSKPVGPTAAWGGHIFGAGMRQSQLVFTGSAPYAWATVDASGSGTTFTIHSIISSLFSNYVPVSAVLSGTGVPAGTILTAQTAGNNGQAGTYTTDQATTCNHDTVTVSWVACPLSLNGVNYTKIENLDFSGPDDTTNHFSAGVMVWADGVGGVNGGTGGARTSAHGNHFSELFTNGTSVGIFLNPSPYGQAISEFLIINCSLQNHELAGFSMSGNNTLNINILGGGAASCTTGYYIGSGQTPLLQGLSLASNTTDINIPSNANQFFIQGCRTESNNFVSAGGGGNYILIGNQMADSGTGKFFEATGSGYTQIHNCYSRSGTIAGISNHPIWLRGNEWLSRSVNEVVTGTTQIIEWNNGTNQTPMVSSLRTPVSAIKGLRGTVFNSSVTASGNFGTAIAGATQTLDSISNASPAVFTRAAGHNLSARDSVTLTTDGTLPTPLSTATKYIVSATGLSGTAFSVALTSTGSLINTSSSGTGTHSVSNPSGNTVPVFCDGTNWLIG